MIKKIIFLFETFFDLRKYQTLGIEFFEKNGFSVEIWDLTSVLHPEFFKKYTYPYLCKHEGLVIFKDKNAVIKKLKSLSRNDFCMNYLVYNFGSLGIYRALSQSDVKYAVFATDSVPIPESVLFILRMKTLKKIINFKFSGTAWKKIFMKVPFKCLGVRSPNFILMGGEKSITYNYPIDKETKILWGHSSNYDLYLQKKSEIFKEKATAVFIDENFPFVLDWILLGMEQPMMSADKYYPMVNNFFDFIEKKTGLEIVIAADPKSEYEKSPDYYKGRQCVRGKTIDLIRECRLVLAHQSTAVSFANLFNKPIIFMTCSDFKKTYDHAHIEEMAKWFGKKPVFIDRDHDVVFEKEFLVSKAHYDNYRQNFIKIKSSKDLFLGQIIGERLKKGFS